MTRVLIFARLRAEEGLIQGVGGSLVGGRKIVGLGMGELYELPQSLLSALDAVIDLPRAKLLTTEGELAWVYQLDNKKEIC